jgi:hypothetical protein
VAYIVGLLPSYIWGVFCSGEDAASTWLDTYTLRLQGRLLHYFPSGGGTGSGSGDWCAWHQDHGSITGQQLHTGSHSHRTRTVLAATLFRNQASRWAELKPSSWLCTVHCQLECPHQPAGLTAAMYLRGREEVPCPDDTAGLHIRARGDQVVKATIGPSELAFQVHLSGSASHWLQGCFWKSMQTSEPPLLLSNACQTWDSSAAGRRVDADPLGRAPAGDAALCAQRLVTSSRRRQPQHLCGLHAAQVKRCSTL